MPPAMLFYVTVWTAIGSLFGFCVFNTVEMWASRQWKR